MKKAFILVIGLVFLLSWEPFCLAGTYLLEAKIEVEARGSLVEVWVPLPLEDETQKVLELRIKAPGPFLITEEPEYKNRFLYLRLSSPARLSYQALIKREEFSPRPWSAPPKARLLLPDRLVPIEPFRTLAEDLSREKPGPLAKLRAFYDFVVKNLRYDKSGQGWGRGDAIFACQAKRGNCTDFHSLLMALSRAANIPVLFEIGLPVPETPGLVKGYHCWLKTYVEGKVFGLDASEAAKHPETRSYFFGHLDDRRLLLTRGRDLLLSPPQHGPRLNFLYQAYAESGLKPAPQAVTTKYYLKVLSAPEAFPFQGRKR